MLRTFITPCAPRHAATVMPLCPSIYARAALMPRHCRMPLLLSMLKPCRHVLLFCLCAFCEYILRLRLICRLHYRCAAMLTPSIAFSGLPRCCRCFLPASLLPPICRHRRSATPFSRLPQVILPPPRFRCYATSCRCLFRLDARCRHIIRLYCRCCLFFHGAADAFERFRADDADYAFVFFFFRRHA